MSDLHVTFNMAGESASLQEITSRLAKLEAELAETRERHVELVRQMGDHIAMYPGAGVDGFLSHFIISIEFLQGPQKGRIVTMRMPPATQTVARSAPFIYEGPSFGHQVSVPLPDNCTLSGTIRESDFLHRPTDYFAPGQETVWMQILNLDATADSELGPIRIILGETLKREYPDIFRPSLGVAQSLGKSGFPAKLFFNPYAIIETKFGAFRAIHGTLSYGRITGFPPVGTPVSICECIPLEEVEDVRTAMKQGGDCRPIARIIALAHPIDTPMQTSGQDAFNSIETCIRERQKS